MDYFFLYHFLHQQRRISRSSKRFVIVVCIKVLLFVCRLSKRPRINTNDQSDKFPVTYPATSIGRKIRFYEKYRRTKQKRGEIFTLLR